MAKDKADAGLLGLKQIWMDNVDMKRGQGSINAMTSGNLNFVTLRDSFMVANSVKEVEDIEGADKLYKLILDVGELGERIICSGLKEFYSNKKSKDGYAWQCKACDYIFLKQW